MAKRNVLEAIADRASKPLTGFHAELQAIATTNLHMVQGTELWVDAVGAYRAPTAPCKNNSVWVEQNVFSAQVSSILASGPVKPMEQKVANKKKEGTTPNKLGNYAIPNVDGFDHAHAMAYARRSMLKRGKSTDGMKPVIDDNACQDIVQQAYLLFLYGSTNNEKTNAQSAPRDSVCKGNFKKSLDRARQIVRQQNALPNQKGLLVEYGEDENGNVVRKVRGVRSKGKIVRPEHKGRKSNARRRGIKVSCSIRKEAYLEASVSDYCAEFSDATKQVISWLASGASQTDIAVELGVSKMSVSRIVATLKNKLGLSPQQDKQTAIVYYHAERVEKYGPFRPNVKNVVITAPPPADPMERNHVTDTSKPNVDHTPEFNAYLQTITTPDMANDDTASEQEHTLPMPVFLTLCVPFIGLKWIRKAD